jgi:hypothetical protein
MEEHGQAVEKQATCVGLKRQAEEQRLRRLRAAVKPLAGFEAVVAKPQPSAERFR